MRTETYDSFEVGVGCVPSVPSSALANSFAVSNMARRVVARSPNCCQPLNIKALPSSVSPANETPHSYEPQELPCRKIERSHLIQRNTQAEVAVHQLP